MEEIKLALTEKRKINGMGSIFPEDYFDIPGVEAYQDIDAVKRYAGNRLKNYEGKTADIYVNGGMAIETLSVIQAAGELGISLRFMHYDLKEEMYLPQKLDWKPRPYAGKRERELFQLCQGRHNLREKPIFRNLSDEQIYDFQWQENHAEEVLKQCPGKELDIYLSGLTPVFISVLNAAYKLKLPVIFWHFDNDTEEYFPQAMDVVLYEEIINE